MSEKATTGDSGRETPGFTVRDFIDARQMKMDLTFNPVDLTSAMIDQAGLFSHYGVLAANASHQTDVVKLLLENTEAAVYKVERERFLASGEKFTEALLEKLVSRHPRVISMKKALIEARRVEAIGKIAVEGLRHRRDMLVQHGLISREEMKGEIQIAARNAKQDALELQKETVLERLKNKAPAQN